MMSVLEMAQIAEQIALHLHSIADAAQRQADKVREDNRFANLQENVTKQIMESTTPNGYKNVQVRINKRGEYAFFLSHYKAEAGVVATLLYQILTYEAGLGKNDVFLDTEALKDLHTLKQKVQNSDVIIAILTKGYLTRPWCLIELYEAIIANVEIKPIYIVNGGYNFDDMIAFLTSNQLEEDFEKLNPGAYRTLVKEQYDPKEICSKIANTLPYLLAKPFDPQASLSVKKAQVGDALGLQM
jgi:hypothetical protein